MKLYEPYTEPQFEWDKVDSIMFNFDCYVDTYQEREYIKDFELLYNYKRYRKECDTDMFETYNDVYYVLNNEKVTSITYNPPFLTPYGQFFSTEQHAETFLQLAKENDCL